MIEDEQGSDYIPKHSAERLSDMVIDATEEETPPSAPTFHHGIVLLEIDGGDWAIVDLATGKLPADVVILNALRMTDLRRAAHELSEYAEEQILRSVINDLFPWNKPPAS